MHPWIVLSGWILSFTIACAERNPTEAPNVKPSDKSADGSKKNDKKCFQVVGGAPTTDYPYVGLIAVKTKKGIERCTGTFVGHNVMLTASHCLFNSKTGDVVYIASPPKSTLSPDFSKKMETGIKPLKAIIGEPEITKDAPPVDNPTNYAGKDIAVLIFPDQTAQKFIPILTKELTSEDKVTIVGYGVTLWPDPKSSTKGNYEELIKRKGTNQLLQLEDHVRETFDEMYGSDFYIFGGRADSKGNKEETDAIGGHGDSGGPLLFKETLVGVSTAGNRLPANRRKDFDNREAITFFAKLQSTFAEKVLKRATNEGADIQYTKEPQGASLADSRSGSPDCSEKGSSEKTSSDAASNESSDLAKSDTQENSKD